MELHGCPPTTGCRTAVCCTTARCSEPLQLVSNQPEVGPTWQIKAAQPLRPLVDTHQQRTNAEVSHCVRNLEWWLRPYHGQLVHQEDQDHTAPRLLLDAHHKERLCVPCVQHLDRYLWTAQHP